MRRGRSEKIADVSSDAGAADRLSAARRAVDGGKKPRVPGLDIIRGLALVSMVGYHLLYDLVYIFGWPLTWFSSRGAYLWQQSICITFILVAGISFTLGRQRLKNVARLALCAALLSAVTWLVTPEQLICFGILHFMAAALLLTTLLAPLLARVAPGWGFGLALFLFFLCRHLPSGYVGFFGLWRHGLPAGIYRTPYLFWLGLPGPDFRSADYFPLLPWYWLYLAGYFGAGCYGAFMAFLRERCALTERKVYRLLDGSVGWLGRHSLIVYMVHQPLLYGLLWLLR